MRKRVTVVLDEDIVKKLHERQSREIKKSLRSVSFSKVINDIVRKGLE